MPAKPITGDALRDFMRTKLRVDTSGIADDTPLFSTSLIDSLAMVELIGFVESTTGVRFEPDDVSLDNLDSIRQIIDFVQRQP